MHNFDALTGAAQNQFMLADNIAHTKAGNFGFVVCYLIDCVGQPDGGA